MAPRGERRRRADIVEYWRAVEMFSPQDVPKIDKPKRVFPVDGSQPLPWERGHRLRNEFPGSGKSWQHTVYCGIYGKEAVRDVLLDVFGRSEEEHDGRLGGDGALLAFDVSDEGHLVQDSVTFSACAWAVGRARKPGPGAADWLDGFDAEVEDRTRTVLDLGDGKLKIIDRAGGLKFAGLACEMAISAVGGGLGPALGSVIGDVAGGAVAAAAQAGALRSLPDRAAGEEGSAGDAEGGSAAEEDSPNLGDKTLTVRDLAAVTRWLSEEFGVTADLSPDAVRVKSWAVSRRRAGKPGGSDFLNSFIAEDLSLVAGELVGSDPGKALGDYLMAAADVPVAERVDVRENPRAVAAVVEPARFAPGRWPARIEHPLVLSQQFAVNAVMERLADEDGVFGVNGPPGTGKTTLLRDLVAAVLVQRAQRLADLSKPNDAFTGRAHQWRVDSRRRSIRRLRPEITGFEIVIASANNGAVENVSTEIPAASSVGEEWQAEAEYFPEQGRLILDGVEAWGALAAKLGNKSNRRAFRDRYWYGRSSRPVRPAGADGQGSRIGGREEEPAATGMRELLKGRDSAPPQPEEWPEAVRRFRDAEQAVSRMQEERQRAADALRDLPKARRAVDSAGQAIEDSEAQRASAEASLRDTRGVLNAWEGEVSRSAQRRAQHRESRPGFTDGLFTWGGAQRDWRAEDRPLAEAQEAAERSYDEHRQIVTAAERNERTARTEVALARTRRREAEERLNTARQAVERVRREWGDHAVTVHETGLRASQDERSEDERRELSTPWADPGFTAARTRLFIEAMNVHRAFLEGAADRMRKNLDGAMDVLCGDAPADIKPEVVQAAWESLFLAVPVVSTTFASFARMFAGLGSRALGWLLVDEAGQATPQMLVGALWRARRAVVVGDPLQLEPVVTLPYTGEQTLRRNYGVDEEWSPSATSAQRVADRLNRYGTSLPAPEEDDEGTVWVGSPLRVHRRCDDPMFSVSNEIAYDGLMVHGVQRDDPYPPARRSVWWDVPAGPAASGKWSSEEGEAANVIIHRLFDQGLDPGGLFVVSPFRDVVSGLKDRLCRAARRDRIGTVHTTQGKEADVVLVVLGAGGERSGPRAWAAARPNLLNVAVSRARRRLFVIGEYGAWSGHPHFDVLARRLDRLTDREQEAMRSASPAHLPGGACRCGGSDGPLTPR